MALVKGRVDYFLMLLQSRVKFSQLSEIDKIGYICQDYRSWEGYSHDEFKYLPFKELSERGRTGKVQEPVLEQYRTASETKTTKKNKKY